MSMLGIMVAVCLVLALVLALRARRLRAEREWRCADYPFESVPDDEWIGP